jgi:hypothetical protein
MGDDPQQFALCGDRTKTIWPKGIHVWLIILKSLQRLLFMRVEHQYTQHI